MNWCEKYYKELEEKGHSFEKCFLHFCYDWDELPVCTHLPETEGCTCESKDESNALALEEAASNLSAPIQRPASVPSSKKKKKVRPAKGASRRRKSS